MTDVAAAGDRLVAVGWGMMNDSSEQVVVWASTVGLTWTDVPLDPVQERDRRPGRLHHRWRPDHR
jgi:hypothetical protein